MFGNRWVLLGVIVVVSVVADQTTKLYAESRLASARYDDHHLVLEVPQEFDGKTVKEFLTAELSWSTETEVDQAARIFTRTHEGLRLTATTPLKGGQSVHVLNRTSTVIEGNWHHLYARNYGAAFSFMADADPGFRRLFFLFTAGLTILLILWFLYKAEPGQRRLVVALSLVLGGAIGNLIDRVAYGYVIDFISWSADLPYFGFKTWPTFNIADVVIVAGVGLMAVELIWGVDPNADTKKDEGGEDGDDASKVASAKPAE